MPEIRPPMNFPPDWSGFGPKMQGLKERERRFVWAFLINSLADGKENASQAARDAGYPDTSGSARVRASALMHRDDILDAMQEVSVRKLRGLVVPAVQALEGLLGNSKHRDHRKAIEMVLERIAPAPRTQLDVNVHTTVTINHTDQALEDLRILLGMGAAREKLVEVFGYSGLSRYEKMLAEQDARSGKVIEHRKDE